ASLGIRVDSNEAKQGTAALNELTGAAESAESAVDGIAPAMRRGGDAARSAAPGFRSAGDAARTSATSVAATRQVLDPLTNAYRKVEGAQAGINASMKAGAISAGQYSMAMRQLPMQITDVVTGLISGQPAYMVAIQQGGQLRDSF